MEWATLYVTILTCMGVFSSCTLAALGARISWRKYKSETMIGRMKHVLFDGIMGAVFGAAFPAFAIFVGYSYCFDRDVIYNKLL